MSRRGRLLRFILLIGVVGWFGYELLRFPVRVELKAVILFGLAIVLYIAVGEVGGINRR